MPNRHYQASPDLADFVHALPKTEQHVHLEGSMSFAQLHAFDPDRYPEEPPFWEPDFRFDGFDHFQAQFGHWIAPYHTSLERYHETARHVFTQCAAQGVRHVEASFHLPAASWVGADGPALMAAILDAAPPGLSVRLFGGMAHNDYEEHGALLEEALRWPQLTGIDLHGPEYWPVHDAFPDYWRRARDHGKITKAHAGEFMPAEFVDFVVNDMAVTRVQHGVRAVESVAVVQQLAEADIVLDVCPISNLKLGVEGIPTMAEHPIRRLIDAGVCVTINTDDTFLFGNSLAEEYYALHQELGFSKAELATLARNGIERANLDVDAKAHLLTELDEVVASHVAGPGG